MRRCAAVLQPTMALLLSVGLSACVETRAGPESRPDTPLHAVAPAIARIDRIVGPDDAEPEPDMRPPRIQCARVPCGDTPPASARSVARALYERHTDFFLEPDAAHAVLTPGLHALLVREHACARAHGMCAIAADPWSAAQDGVRGAAIDYRTLQVERRVMGSPTHARVQVCFEFVLHPQAPATRCAIVVVTRRLHVPWQVDDLVDPDGQSLRALLQAGAGGSNPVASGVSPEG